MAKKLNQVSHLSCVNSNQSEYFFFINAHFIYFQGIAEELCRLFPVDDEIDMTPILRRSKESARRQRSRPESERQSDVPHTRPLADRIR